MIKSKTETRSRLDISAIKHDGRVWRVVFSPLVSRFRRNQSSGAVSRASEGYLAIEIVLHFAPSFYPGKQLLGREVREG